MAYSFRGGGPPAGAGGLPRPGRDRGRSDRDRDPDQRRAGGHPARSVHPRRQHRDLDLRRHEHGGRRADERCDHRRPGRHRLGAEDDASARRVHDRHGLGDGHRRPVRERRHGRGYAAGRSDVTASDPSHYFGVSPLHASFNADPTSGSAPLVVRFTDTSTGEIANRAWDFGDGTTSTETNPLHTYTTPGEYTVTLRVATAGGSESETGPSSPCSRS